MHTLTPRLEQALRAHGIDDDDLGELLRAGSVERSDARGGSSVLRIDGDGGAAMAAPASRVTLDGLPLTADSPDDLLERLRSFHATAHTPEVVTVSGTDATTDTAITMLAGATGARIPTGQHLRSGAMPGVDPASDDDGASGGDSNAVALAILTAAIVVLVMIAAYLLAR